MLNLQVGKKVFLIRHSESQRLAAVDCQPQKAEGWRVEFLVAAHVSVFSFSVGWSLRRCIDNAVLSLRPESYCFLLNPERPYPQISDRIMGIIEKDWVQHVTSIQLYILSLRCCRHVNNTVHWGRFHTGLIYQTGNKALPTAPNPEAWTSCFLSNPDA